MKEALQLIAIRIGEGSTGGRKLSSEKPYYFLEGYAIVDDKHVKVSRERAKAVNIYNDYFHNEQQYPSSLSRIPVLPRKYPTLRIQDNDLTSVEL